MTIKVTFECNGCDAKTDPVILNHEFVSITGKSHGFGSRQFERAQDLAPDGWCVADIIGCTYCPDCCAEIWPDEQIAAGGE